MRFSLKKQQVRTVLNWTRRTMADQCFDDSGGIPDTDSAEFCGSYARAREGAESNTARPWFAVARGIMQHPVIGERAPVPSPADPARRAWTYGEAFLHGLVENASFRRRIVRDTNGADVVLEAGQLRASRKVLARRFNWSEKAVRVFLAKLENAGMIAFFKGPGVADFRARGKGQGSNVLTVCNYGKYQNAVRPKGQGQGQPPRQFGASYRKNKEEEQNSLPIWKDRKALALLDSRDTGNVRRMIRDEVRRFRGWPATLGPAPASGDDSELFPYFDRDLVAELARWGVEVPRAVFDPDTVPSTVVPFTPRTGVEAGRAIA